MARFMDDLETPPTPDLGPTDPADDDFQDALAELNALTVRFEATKVQHARWRNKFFMERRRLMETMRQAIIKFDQEKAARPSSPPRIHFSPERRHATPSSNSPAPSLVQPTEPAYPSTMAPPNSLLLNSKTQHEASNNNAGHGKLVKTSSNPMNPALTPTSNKTYSRPIGNNPPSLSRSTSRLAIIVATEEEGKGHMLEESILEHIDGHIEAPTAYSATPSTTTAQHSVVIDLRQSDDLHEMAPSRSTINNSPINESLLAGVADNPAFLHQNSAAAMEQYHITSPHLVVDAKPGQHAKLGQISSQPPRRLVHRATAMDLDEVKRMAQRTFQRQQSSNFLK